MLNMKHSLCWSVVVLLLFLAGVSALDTCSDPQATLYDGHLDTYIHYASFKKTLNSYFRFKNPTNGTDPITEMTVMFWARFPSLAANDMKGMLFESSNQLQIRLANDTLNVQVAFNSTLRAMTSHQIFKNNFSQLSQWNHFAIVYKDKNVTILMNGVNVSTIATPITQLNTTATEFCVIGNALAFNDSANVQIRHFTILNYGLVQNSSTQSLIHNQILPTNNQVIAYFKFNKYFTGHGAYFYNATWAYQTNQVVIEQSAELEPVCYCQGTTPAVLKLDSNSLIKTIDIPAVDQNGFTLELWLFPLNLTAATDTTLFSIPGYTDVVLANGGNQIRLDLFNGYIASPITFNSYRFRWRTWVSIGIQVISNQCILFVDGVERERQTHNVRLLNLLTPQFKVGLGPVVQSLIYKMALYKNLAPSPTNYAADHLLGYQDPYNTEINYDATQYQTMFKYYFNKENLLNYQQVSQNGENININGYFFSNFINISPNNSYFSFSQNNELCSPQGDFSSGWDGLACKTQRKVANFNRASPSQQYVNGMVRSANPQMTIDFWFKMDYDIITPNYPKSTIFANYEFLAGTYQALISIHLTQDTLTGQYTIVCDPYARAKVNRQASISAQQAIRSGSWLHFACVSDKDVTQTMSAVIYNMDNKIDSASTTSSAYIIVQQPNTPLLTFIGNAQDFNSPFKGSLREFRMFNTSLSMDQIKAMRHAKVPKILLQSGINAYSFANGYESLQLLSAVSQTQTSALTITGLQNPITWTVDKDLVICPQETFYDGNCCVKTNIAPVIQITPINSTLTVTAILGSVNIEKSSSYLWKVTAVNPTNAAYLASLQSLIVSQSTFQTMNLPIGSLFHNSSVTFSVEISSIYLQNKITNSTSYSLPCPKISLSNPNSLILHAFDDTPLALVGTINRDCFQFPGLIATSVIWQSNTTTTQEIFTVSFDQTSITFNQKDRIIPDIAYSLTFKVVFSNGMTMTENRVIKFVRNPVTFAITSSQTLSPGAGILINANSTQYNVNTYDLSQLQLTLDCPPDLLPNYNSQCKFNQTNQLFSLRFTDMNQPVYYYPYQFAVGAGKKGSMVYLSQNVTITWIPTYQFTCPQVSVPASINVKKSEFSTFAYNPQFQFDCLVNNTTVSYKKVSNIVYSLNQERINQYAIELGNNLNITTFSEGFSLFYNELQFRFNPTAYNKIVPGNIIPITITTTVVDPLQTNGSTLTLSANMNILVQMSDINIVYTVSASNVQFQDDFKIDASGTTDPDLPTSEQSQLVYSFLINNQAITVSASQRTNTSVTLNTLDRLAMGINFDTPYLFTIVVYNPLIPKKPYYTRNFSISFAPPINPTHYCPSSLFKQSGNSISQVTYNTLNVTSVPSISMTMNNCDSLAFSFNSFLAVFPNATFNTNNKAILQFPNKEETTFTLSQAALLNQIKVSKTATISGVMIFVVNATGKIGFILSNLTLSRQPSPLQPFMTPTTNDSSIMNMGFEETIIIDTSKSFDPDVNYRDFSDPFVRTYTCSPNLNALCSQIQNSTSFTITKSQRIALGITLLGAQMSITYQMRSNSRQSLSITTYFTLVEQDYRRCVAISDSKQRIIIDDVDDLEFPILLSPTIQQMCDVATVSSSATWSTSFGDQTAFWSTNGVAKQSILIDPLQLRKLPRSTNIEISVQMPFKAYFLDYTSYVFTYVLSLNPSIPVLEIVTPDKIDITSPLSQHISYSLTNYNSPASSVVCNYTCYIGDQTIRNCSQGLCTFNISPIILPFNPADLTSKNNYIRLGVQTDAGDFSTYKMLPLVSALNPSCSVQVQENPKFAIDKVTVFKVDCTNFNSASLVYKWSIEGLQAARDFINGDSYSQLKVRAYSFSKTKKTLQFVKVVVSQNGDPTRNATVFQVVRLQDSSNIVMGTLRVVGAPAITGNAFSTPFNITLNGFRDTRGGSLYYQLRYVSSNNNYAIMSKSTQTTFEVTFPYLESFFLDVFDERGGYNNQIIYPLLSNSTISKDMFDYNYNRMKQKILSGYLLSFSTIQGDHAVIENVIEQLASTSYLLYSKNIFGMDDATYLQYKGDVINLLNAQLQLAIQYISYQASLSSSMQKTLQILANCYDPTLAEQIQTITSQALSISGSTVTNTQGDTYQTVDNILYLTSNNSTSSKQTLAKLKSNMVSGESVYLNRSLTIIKKVVPSDLTENSFAVTSNNVKFQVSQQFLSNLNQDGTFVDMSVLPTQNFQQPTNSAQYLSSVMDITLTDANSDKYNIVNQTSNPLQLVFNNVQGLDSAPYINCGYFDYQKNKWRIDMKGTRQGNQITCQTIHLSTFAVFSTVKPVDGEPSNPGDPDKDEDGGEKPGIIETIKSLSRNTIAILVELGILVLSLIIFAIGYSKQVKMKGEIEDVDLTRPGSRKSLFSLLFSKINPLVQVFKNKSYSILVKLFVLVNVILALSLSVLILNAIALDVKVKDSVVFIILTGISYVLASPFLAHTLIYSHVKEEEQKKVQERPKPSELYKINDVTEEVKLDFEDQTVITVVQEFERSPFEKMSQPQTMKRNHSISCMTDTDFGNMGNSDSMDERGVGGDAGLRGKHLKELGKELVKSPPKKVAQSEVKTDQIIKPFQYEGGEPEYNHQESNHTVMVTDPTYRLQSPMRNLQSPSPLRQQDRSMNDLSINQSSYHFKQNRHEDQYETKVKINSARIILLQMLVFLVLAGLNAYLFYQSKISNTYKAYFGTFIVQMVIFFFFCDTLISLLSALALRKVKSVKQFKKCQNLMVFGFVGVPRLKQIASM